MARQEKNKVALDADFIRKLYPTIPAKGDVTYWDSVHEGLCLRVRDGKMAFYWRRKLGTQSRKPKIRDVAIGPHLEQVIAFAHEQAIRYNNSWSEKEDVKQVIERKAQERVQADLDAKNTFGSAYKAWVNRVKEKGSSETDTDRQKVIRWLGGEAVSGTAKQRGGRKVALPQPSELWKTPFKLVNKHLVGLAMQPYLGKPATARKIYSYCSTAYASEAANHGIAINPFEAWFSDKGIKAPKRRKRYLDLNEPDHRDWLKELYASRNEDDDMIALQADYLLCCLFWGGRATETAKLRIDDVHPDVIVRTFDEPELPWAVFLEDDTKSGNAHYFPLTALALDVLRTRLAKSTVYKDNTNRWVFPSREREFEDGPRKHMTGWGVRRLLDALEAKTGVKIRPHDLRRTLATEVSIATHRDKGMIKLALNHNRDVTDGYIQARADIDALRPLFEKREDKIKRVLNLSNAATTLPEWVKPFILNPLYSAEVRALLETVGADSKVLDTAH